MSHYDASLYTARRLEMCNIVEATFVYLIDRPTVHSPYSDMPFMVSLMSEYEFHGVFVCSTTCRFIRFESGSFL